MSGTGACTRGARSSKRTVSGGTTFERKPVARTRELVALSVAPPGLRLRGREPCRGLVTGLLLTELRSPALDGRGSAMIRPVNK